MRVALETCRAELPSLGVAESVIENTIRMYAVELDQLARLARGVRLITDALLVNGAPHAALGGLFRILRVRQDPKETA